MMVILCSVLLVLTIQVVYTLPNTDISTTGSSGNSSDVDCKICLSIFSSIHYALTDDYWKQLYGMFTTYLCTFLSPGTVKNFCIDHGDEYMQKVLELIGSEIQPKYMCQNLHKCVSGEKIHMDPRETVFKTTEVIV
ncbi:unnamed protein product [Heterobilharzia americana]|nr:unnamed protein product [Heterobilharzia americana]